MNNENIKQSKNKEYQTNKVGIHDFNFTFKFEWCVGWCGFNIGYIRDACLNEMGCMCPQFNNHYRLHSSHNWGGLRGAYMTYVSRLCDIDFIMIKP